MASLQNSTDTSNKEDHQYYSNYTLCHKRKEHNKISLKKVVIYRYQNQINKNTAEIYRPITELSKDENSQYNVFQRDLRPH